MAQILMTVFIWNFLKNDLIEIPSAGPYVKWLDLLAQSNFIV